MVVQTIQYYGWASFDDKKFGHLFRFCIEYSPYSRSVNTTYTLRFTYETEDFNHLDLIQEIEVDPGFPVPA